MVFSVIFEEKHNSEHWSTYVAGAKILRPISESIPGHIDHILYRSLTREGWNLSLSSWANEKALVRWRTTKEHCKYQDMGRNKLLVDYHLRVGLNVQDSHGAAAAGSLEQTEVGDATMILLHDIVKSPDWVKEKTPENIANSLGLRQQQLGLVQWDVFDEVLQPGHVLLLSCWKDQSATLAFEGEYNWENGVRLRTVQIVRDYGMFDRREAPQYYPDVVGRTTLHH
ncbi:uncharacterized protein KY384_006899 [Bacidia gigantensis]|uniref:uncharacterized protein n=1 Tax=Bacidia gigantensis TaxID=2732470 RepID=UPI001D055652|nr:uncharacterized protein KY384_006899 [Bacidia gigantensis]KAG8527983.1 hypothetical protein KY384_006899 [Bacidia gigantensis]